MARIGLARDENLKKFRILEPCQISKSPERQKSQNFGQALLISVHWEVIIVLIRVGGHQERAKKNNPEEFTKFFRVELFTDKRG
jgi:hypothetical protein